MGRKIFISYSHEDKGFANYLVEKLQKASISVWYDANEIKIGDSVQDKINEGIAASSSIVFLISKHSSRSSWLQYELNAALLHNASSNGIKIFVVLLDSIELPAPLSNTFIFEAFKDKDAAVRALITDLKVAAVGNYPKLDWRKITPRNFEELVYELLQRQGYAVLRSPKTRDGGVDFVITNRNALGLTETYLVETKLYRDKKVSLQILNQLYALSIVDGHHNVLLITNAELTNVAKEFLSTKKDKIALWTEADLLSKIYDNPDILEKYFQLRPLKNPRQVKLVDQAQLDMLQLIKRLDKCPSGKAGWKEYEDICIAILNQLFGTSLDAPKIQSRRADGSDIRDAIFPNRSQNKNWRFIREDYDAKYIVFEFKNYADEGSEIDKGTVLQIGDYLKKTIGRLGIVCSPKKPEESALKKRKDLFNEQNKLILFLTNEHLKDMLYRQYIGQDPADVIIDLIDEFNLDF